MNSLTSSLGLFNLGLVEMLVVGGVLVLFFGARRLPGLMRGLGMGKQADELITGVRIALSAASSSTTAISATPTTRSWSISYSASARASAHDARRKTPSLRWSAC